MSPEIKEERPSDLKAPISVNSFKTTIEKDGITLEFGNLDSTKKPEAINVVASVVFDPKLLTDLIVILFTAGIQYQNTHNIDIGFPKNLDQNTDIKNKSE